MRQDRDDAIPLEYAPYEGELEESSEYEESEDEDMEATDAMDVDPKSPVPQKRRQGTPPLHLSPISNPPSPSRKRARMSNWNPPEHIPDFLPPFPSNEQVPESAHPSPRLSQPPELPPVTDDKPAAQVSQALTTTASTSDIHIVIPYSQSTLATLPERHLPGPPPRTSSSLTRPSQRYNTPQIEPSFIAAYHYILTHPPPAVPPPSTVQRHRVATSLLGLIQTKSRWTPSDSLYGSVAPCPPRIATVPPSYPVAVTDLGADSKPKDTRDRAETFKFPQMNNRPVAGIERLAPLVGQPASRLPDLARHVLHVRPFNYFHHPEVNVNVNVDSYSFVQPAILNRSTRLAHPPVLQRGSKPLVYGHGVAAPWNSNPIPPTDANGVPQTPIAAKSKDNSVNGKADEETPKPAIPDALLFATWDYDSKDFRVPLPRHRGRMGSIAAGGSSSSGASGSGTITLPHITRKGSMK
jgi:Wiskott-Aldrich syndrome protein